MTQDELQAVARAIANTTDFDGDRMASRYSDRDLRDVAIAAIAALDAARGKAQTEVGTHPHHRISLALGWQKCDSLYVKSANRGGLPSEEPGPDRQCRALSLSAGPIASPVTHYTHLPMALQASSRPFCELAAHIVTTLPRNAERSVALRKLPEAKDAAVRANVP